MDGWRLDVVHMLGEGGGARNNLRISPALPRRRSKRSRKPLSLANILATRASGCRRMLKMRR
jgi:glycosidase